MRAPGLFETVDRCDVRMVERGQHLRLALESSQSFGVVGELIGEDFDRHVATELGVLGSVDLTHPAFANGLDYLVVGELVTRLERHSRSRAMMLRRCGAVGN